MKTPVHIDSDAKTIVDADGKHIVVLMAAGTHADLEKIANALNVTHTVSERAKRSADEYVNREIL